MADSVAEDYRSSLTDLNFNSKPHINVLTMIAEENAKHAPKIVETIISHINKVPPTAKLPSLYLVDSIMKNVGGQYLALFSKHMVTLFTSVFSKVEEATRSSLYKLRQTWNEILPKIVLYELDCKVNNIDPAWPITANPAPTTINPAPMPAKNTIHVNPKFLPNTTPQPAAKPPTNVAPKTVVEKKMEATVPGKLNEMLRQIEEKKIQLKALEQKKLEMAAKQKKAQQDNEPQIVINSRDPRLKKNVTHSESVPVKIPLQSVVVMPSLQDLPVDSSSTNSNKSDQPNASDQIQTEMKPNQVQIKIEPCDPAKVTIKEEPNILSEMQNRKRSLSSEEQSIVENDTGKKQCKSPVNKSKRLAAERECLHSFKEERSYSKKGKHEFTKSTNKHNSEYSKSKVRDQVERNQSVKDTSQLFGNEDKDYRQQSRNSNFPKSRQWYQRGRGFIPSRNHRIPHPFFPRHRNLDRFSQRNLEMQERRSGGSPILHPSNDNNYHRPDAIDFNTNIVKTDPDCNVQNELNQFKPIMQPNGIQNQNYKMNSDIPQERLPPPHIHKTFKLDGKDRIIYFVNKRALTLMDNDEPRELTFSGKPTSVFIEGLLEPLTLNFDGVPVEFETEGKKNTIHFGTPSREIYINNFPYEAQFGGSPFTALLEDKKEHKVRLDGPPPQVVISEKPAYELFELYNQTRRISPQPLPVDPNANTKVSATSNLLLDVDMRVKPSPLVNTSVRPEGIRDIDWRHGPIGSEGSQIPWNATKESSDCKVVVPSLQSRSFAGTVPNIVMPGPPSQWDDTSKRLGIHREGPIPDGSYPSHSGYRQMLPALETARFDHPLPRPPAPPVAPLLPPPAIPPSLGLSTSTSLPAPTLPNLPPVPVSVSSWNPLPPPPMFTGSVPEVKPAPVAASAIPSTIVPNVCIAEPAQPTVPSLPVNVTTIFEKLVAAGIITKTSKETVAPVPEPEPIVEDVIVNEEVFPEGEEHPEIALVPKLLREFRPYVVAALYRGSQCATCGMRFKEIQSEQYSRHLDWHFRMNRREKDGAKKAYSRRLFYEIKDWVQFKEVEEAEERAPSYFELQADGEPKNEEEEKIQSVPASESEAEKCAVCSEKFQLFWIEEEEEWHLKHAVQHDGEVYHPLCYEDFKKAEELAKKAEEEAARVAEEQAKAAAEEAARVAEEAERLAAEEAALSAAEDAKVKEEPIEDSKEEPKSPEASKSNEESESDNKPPDEPAKEESTDEPSEMEVVEEEEVKNDVPEPAPVKEEPVEQVMGIHSDAESDGEDFRPPTPDPRFDEQPPIFKCTEMSALCIIM